MNQTKKLCIIALIKFCSLLGIGLVLAVIYSYIEQYLTKENILTVWAFCFGAFVFYLIISISVNLTYDAIDIVLKKYTNLYSKDDDELS